MPSVLTDAVRNENYAICRKRKQRLDKFFDVMMWIELYICTTVIIVSAFSTFTYTFVTGTDIDAGARFLYAVVALLGVIYAFYTKHIKPNLLVLTAQIILMVISEFAAGVVIALFLSIINLIASIRWEKLEQEPGFPLFDISYEELKERQLVQEKRTHFQALQYEERRVNNAECPAAADMEDLLDTVADTPIAFKHLEKYHDRYYDNRPLPDEAPAAPAMSDALECIPAMNETETAQNTRKDGEYYVSVN